MSSIIIIQKKKSNLIKKINPIKHVAPDLRSMSRCARKKYVYDHDVKSGAKCIKWNRRSTAEGKLTANCNVHFVLFVTQSYRTHLVNFGIVFLLKIAESTYTVHLWTSAALIVLNGKEQHEHCSEYHRLCSTEESQSYRLILVE